MKVKELIKCNLKEWPLNYLEFDGELSDLRLHLGENFSWYAKKKKDYQAIEKSLNEQVITGTNFEIYVSYDVSGWHYWVKQMEEPNYMNITVSFQNLEDEININELESSLSEMIDFCQTIHNNHCYEI